MKRSLKRIIILLSVLFGFSSANSATIFGPETYNRSNGPPNIFTETFDTLSGKGTLRVQNGEMDSKGKIRNAVTSARIFVNNVEIFGPSDFKKKVHYLEAPVDLVVENDLRVELRGKPGTFLSVEIVQEIPAPSIGAFSAQPETISPGAVSRLEWETQNATNVVLDHGIGAVDPDG
ncbi:MAG: hypothetical protein JRL30_13655 [Deltaproteobacteria bacterium]|nr:hypothetical protein [Deltaproteobacteria bacterium]